jgi:DNA-binding winged helix-turn-helix (wHTH) protein/TolB-like protein/Flp pilus assembly protein TadD
MSGQTSRFYSFDSFTLDASRRALLRDGETVPLKPKTFEMLLALVQNHGRVVGKDELMRELWPDSFVEEANLTQQVSLLRKALGDDPKEPRFIVTVPGRGYSFVADVREAGEPHATHSHELQPETVGAASPPRPRPAARRWALPTALTALVTVVAVAFALGYLWSRRGGAGAPVKSVAVLPFKSEAAGGEDDYLRLGLADALSSRLSGLRQVAVLPTSEVLKYDKPGQDPLAVGRALGADAVLDGVLRKDGERLRVTARLLDVRTGGTLWAETFDEPWAGIFDVQDAITARVGEGLAVSLDRRDRERLAKRPTDNPEAYVLYMQAEYLVGKHTQEGYQRAWELYQRATELDPKFADAYFSLAQTYAWPRPGLSERESYEKQKELLAKTLALDPSHARAYALLAAVKWRTEWDWAGAERGYRAALEFSPNDHSVHFRFGSFLVSQGHFEEGLAHLRRAHELSPTTLAVSGMLGFMYVYARRYDEAIAQCREVTALDPNIPPAHACLGLAYSFKGAHTEAVEELEQSLKLGAPNPTGTRGYLGHVYARAGRREEALRTLEEVKGLEQQGRRSDWGAEAVIYAGLGESEAAFRCLEKSLQEKEWWVSSLKVNPLFDPLRSDPRFAELVRRTGLEP